MDMRNQTKLVMQPYANWWHYLTHAPLSIAILGELVFISSNTDFSINKHPPKDGYKFINYPDSFRACLMQVCNSGWWAFNEAHKNMDKIRLHTLNVPDYMKKSVKILFKGNDEVVNALLPDSLDNICTITHDCQNLAKETEKRFTDVTNIINELLEACSNAEHCNGEELDEIQKKLEENKMRKEAAEKATKNPETFIKAMEEELQKSRKSYNTALNFIPSGWEMMAMDFNRFRVEQSHAQLQPTRESYTKVMEKNQKELTEILILMRKCEVKEIDINTTIKMLVKVMDAMERVKVQWEKMVQLFLMVTNIVEIYLSNTLKNLVNLSEKTKTLSYDGRPFCKDILYNQAFQASNIAGLVHMISSTYTEVSDKYLMDPVSSLGKLLTMDQSKPEFLLEQLQLRDKCDEAGRAILQLVQKNREEFERKTDERLEKIDKELLAILPPDAP